MKWSWPKWMTGNSGEKVTLAPQQKGSIAPFDRIGFTASTSLEKLEKPYANSVWVQAAMRKVMAPVCTVPLQFFGDARGGKQAITDPAVIAFWQKPAIGPGQTRLKITEVIEASLGWLQLEGEFFWILDNAPMPFPEVLPAGGLRPFIVARPDRMRAVVSQGQLIQWAYTDGAQRTTLLEPAQVIHVKCWNPYSDFRGLSPWQSARIATEADYLAGRFALNLMKNNGDTGPIVIGKSGIPDDAQRAQIEMLLRQKKEMSLRGEFRPLFLGGDITVEDPQVKVPDAAFVAVRLENRHEIFVAFGVPPSMADVKAAYSIGSDSDRHALVTETCVPVSEKLADAVENLFERQTGQTVYAAFDWSKHPVMVAARNERIDNGTKLWDRGMPWEDISEYLDLRLPDFDGWDVGYLPFSVAPSATVAAQEPAPDPMADPALAEDPSSESSSAESDPSTDPVQEMLRVLKRGPGQRAPKLETLWKKHMATRRAAVKLLAGKVRKVLFQHRAQVLKKLPPETKAIEQRGLIDIVFDPIQFGRDLMDELSGPIRQILSQAGQELLGEIGLDDPWTMPPQKAKDFLAGRETPVQNCGWTVRNQLNTSLQAGLDEGETMSELSRRVKDVFNDLEKHEAERIARTETNTAYNDARHVAMDDSGIGHKAWLSSHGPNVRPSHAEAERTYTVDNPIPLTEPFTVNGEQLMYPGDSSLGAGPGNTINCQCIQLAARLEGEEDGLRTYTIYGLGSVKVRHV